MSTPGIDILNTGTGHTEIRFDGQSPEEAAKAARIISDMLARGYSIFVHAEDGALIRVESFDAKRHLYLVDLPDDPPKKKSRQKRKGLPLTETHVTAIGRSAGG